MKYLHFSIEEREKIQQMLWQKSSIRTIAKELDRSPSSVSREITRNLPAEHYQYTPRLANQRALKKRKSRGRIKRLKNNRIRKYVIYYLKRRWSPEQISGRIKIDLGETISHEAIYQFIYNQIYQKGWSYLKPGCEDLRMYLRRRRKRRIHKGLRKCKRMPSFQGISIDLRPSIVNARSRIGDWESDTVESINKKPGINTCVERKTGLVLITKLKDKKSYSTVNAINDRMKFIPKKAKHTMTFDNGPENSGWKKLEELTKIKTYFAHQYHSWERGTNENTNGLIRDYFPKKTDFTIIKKEELSFVEKELNDRPRKRLGWQTPSEAMSVALQS